MSKQQQDINDRVRAIISEKRQSKEPFTQSELEFIQQFAGDGGLAKFGAKSRGLLYEYYTPIPVVEKMWGLAYKHGFTSGHILEPSCGIGRFLRYVDFSNSSVDAFEINPDDSTGFSVAKVSFPAANITNDYFESIFYNEKRKRVGTTKRYDLIIGNPPYGERSNKFSKLENPYTKANTLDQYFIEKGVELLNPNGLLIFIIPSAFLDNDNSYNEVKKHIYQYAELVDAYRLPMKTFTHTDIQTDIIVLKRNP